MSKGTVASVVVLVVLIADQVLKFWIKTHMMLGEEFKFTEWFIIHFTENNGMAFGMEFAGKAGKYFLSVFRIVAVAAIGYYLIKLVYRKAPMGLVISVALIFSGALGNIIDSVFYGVIFNESYFQTATLFPADGGYSSWLQGRVVDMFYFPILKGHYPSWLPLKGGDPFIFFRPVFNIADSAISVGIVAILLFQKRYLKTENEFFLNTSTVMTVRINNQIPLYILILILFFSSCKGDQSPIDEKSMVDILVDLHIAQAAKVRDRVNMRSWESYPYYNYVCQKHHVTKVELDSALSFYSKNEEQYQLLYEKVVDEINRIETEVSSGIYAAEFAKPSINQFGIDSVMFAMDTAITDSIITEIWPFKREYAFNDTTTFRFDIENRAQKQQRFLF